ncbi:uncharacterized protein LOC142331364 [Lycorma delicatula]|uniref:uncharacterized protein LOC142331364 n=1 Tax=Lycorma delicatula TaxID=130591 RepID=UPI003F50F6F7
MAKTHLFNYIIAIFVILNLTLLTYCNTDEVSEKNYLCKNEECGIDEFNGLAFKIHNTIRKCTESLQAEGLNIKNVLTCITIAQNVQQGTNVNCAENDKECKACTGLLFKVYEELGIVRKDGTVNERVLFQIINILKYKAKPLNKFPESWEQCRHIIGNNTWDTALEITMCVSKTIPNLPHITGIMLTSILQSPSICNKPKSSCANF